MAKRMVDMRQGSRNKTVVSNRTGQAADKN
jgi:hypothetical protein